MWEQKARGLFTKKLISTADLSGKDFLISKYDDSFHTNVQTADDVGIPTLLFYENDPGKLTHLNLGEKYWPDDKNEDLQNIINAVMVGGVNGVKRAVHGIMIDCSVTKDHQGKQLDIDFLTQTARNLGDKAWNYLKLPIYYYMNFDPVNLYKGSDLEILRTFIAGCQGISTVDWAEVDENGYPIGWTHKNSSSMLSGLKQRPMLPYDDGQQWPFCLYNYHVGGNIDVISSYTKKILYGELRFSKSDGSSWEDDSSEVPPANSGGDSNDDFPEEIITTNGLLAMLIAEQQKTNELFEIIVAEQQRKNDLFETIINQLKVD